MTHQWLELKQEYHLIQILLYGNSKFLNIISSNTIDNSNWLYTSSDRTIYSLSMFSSTNTLALFIIDASNGSLLQTPYRLNSTINRISGMVLLPSTLWFIASNNEWSVFIIYNLSSKLTISYCFYSQISIFRMGLSYDNNK